VEAKTCRSERFDPTGEAAIERYAGAEETSYLRLRRRAVFFTERFLAATDLRFVAFFRFFDFIAISDSYVLIVVLRGEVAATTGPLLRE
jgi:hypothetical protein